MQGTGHDLLHHPLSASRFSGEKAAVRSRGPSPASSLCEQGLCPPPVARCRPAHVIGQHGQCTMRGRVAVLTQQAKWYRGVMLLPWQAGAEAFVFGAWPEPGHVLRTKVFYAPGQCFAGRQSKVYLKSRKFSLFLQAQLAFALNSLEIHKGFLWLFALNPACACEIFVIFFVFRYTLTFRTCCRVKKGKR